MKRIEQTLTSLEVAEMVEKGHRELLRDIRRYTGQLGQSKIAPSDFFQESSYKNRQNKKMPCYNITKKGCEFIAHKLTGVKGTAFTARYINRFHEMEEIIENGQLPSASTQKQYTVIPKTWEGEPVLFYKDIMAMTSIKKNDIDKYVLNNAPVGGIRILTTYGLPKFKEENPRLEQYLKYTNLCIGIITKDGALELLNGCGCSAADVNVVMDYYNSNKTKINSPVSVADDSEYIYQKMFLSLDKANQNRVLSEMIKLHEEQKENEKKVNSFFSRNPKRKQQKVLSIS